MNYDQDYSHSHCYDTQAGHEKHLKCCLCSKWQDTTEKKCPSCLAGFSREDIAGNCTCDSTDSKVRCTYLYCHGASNGCVPDCSCKKNGHKPHVLPDSEDDAIESIVKDFVDTFSPKFPAKDYHSVIANHLRTALRSYGDMRQARGRQENRDAFTNKWIEEAKEEGRREATLEFSKVSGGYEAGKRAALDELERRMSSISYSSIGAKMLFNSIKNHIEDMRK